MTKLIINFISSQKAITLTSLVVTIIVLIILAGVSINLTSGKNGIIEKTNQEALAIDKTILYQDLQQQLIEYYMSDDSTEDIFNFLIHNGYLTQINDKIYIVNVDNISDYSIKSGNGTYNNIYKDVYIIQIDDYSSKEFPLYYYDATGTSNLIGILGKNIRRNFFYSFWLLANLEWW